MLVIILYTLVDKGLYLTYDYWFVCFFKSGESKLGLMNAWTDGQVVFVER